MKVLGVWSLDIDFSGVRTEDLEMWTLVMVEKQDSFPSDRCHRNALSMQISFLGTGRERKFLKKSVMRLEILNLVL